MEQHQHTLITAATLGIIRLHSRLMCIAVGLNGRRGLRLCPRR